MEIIFPNLLKILKDKRSSLARTEEKMIWNHPKKKDNQIKLGEYQNWIKMNQVKLVKLGV
jgi:hypothetical protein